MKTNSTLTEVLYSVGVHANELTLDRSLVFGRDSCKWTQPWPKSCIR